MSCKNDFLLTFVGMLPNRLITLFALLSVAFSFSVRAQTEADVNVSQGGYGMVRTNITTGYDHNWGKITNSYATRVSYEFLRNSRFTLTANARYASVETDFDASDFSGGYSPQAIGLNGTHMIGQAGFTGMYRTTLFGRPFMAMAMLNSEWGQGGFARISGIAMGLIMLRANRDTQFGIGPLALLNSTSKIPAFLVFMYRHRINEKWLINLYGGMLGIDYTPTRHNLFSAGADVDVKAFYFRPHDPTLPSKCRFTYTTVRPSLRYRRTLARHLYLDIQGGVAVRMSCRVNGVTGTKEYIRCHQKAAPFLHIGASYSL